MAEDVIHEKCAFPPFSRQMLAVSGVGMYMIGTGANIAFPGVLLEQLRKPDSEVILTSESESWIASILGLALVSGIVASPFCLEKYGRKFTNQLSTLPALGGWAVAVMAKDPKALIISRIMQGFAMGLEAAACSVTIAEYSAPKHRGMFLATIAFSFSTGILLAHVFGTILYWRQAAIACGSVYALSLILLTMAPETPPYLASKGLYKQCRKSFRWLRGYDPQAEKELEILINSQKNRAVGEEIKMSKLKFFMEMLPILLALALILANVNAARILYVIPFTSKSHYIMLRPIGLALADRGHNVTVITANQESKHPENYHQVLVDDVKIWDLLGEERPNIFTMVDLPAEKLHDKILWRGGLATTESFLNSTDFQTFLATKQHFDLVIAEQFYQESMYALANKYKAPLILVTTFGNCMRHNIITRNPLQMATVLSEFIVVKEPESFLGRLTNFYFTLYEFYWWKYWYMGKQEELRKKYIGDNGPTLYELQKNASLMLINSHFSFDPPAAYLPNIVEVGGLHLTDEMDELPKDLKRILDASTQGVVYMSFGSNVRSSELPKEKKQAFLRVFSELNQTVVWKWEEDILEGKTKNMVVRKWMPQKEILAHPNTRLFISHGGLIGTQEALYFGVPILGIPIYADQYNNLLQAERMGFGKILEYTDINYPNLSRLIKEIVNSDEYLKKGREAAKRFRDRPMKPLDTAMFWIEYVLRNRGAEFMKNPGLKMSFLAYHMLDVYLVVLSLLIVTILCSLYACVFIVCRLRKYFKNDAIENKKRI